MLFFILFTTTFLINGVFSISIINNVTVSSEVLNEYFYKEVQNNQFLIKIESRGSKVYDSKKCLAGLKEIVEKFPSLDVVPFFDAWGKFPSGLLYGNYYDIGNFDQCVKTSVNLKKTGTVNGQFCFAKVPLQTSLIEPLPKTIAAQPLEERTGEIFEAPSINIGICVPDTCSPEFLTTLFRKSFDNVLGGALSEISVSKCSNGKPGPYTPTIIAGICVFGLFGIMMLLSTLYDVFTNYFQKPQIPILLAFSVITNGRKLFAINTKTSPNSIDCLTGIRVFSMAWIVFSHTYMISSEVVAINMVDVMPWFKTLLSLFVINGNLAVDSFFFISGLLVAWLGFRELDRTKGKLNVVMMYIHRYIRLTPLVAASILFLISLNKIIGGGPFRQQIIDAEKCNGDNFWPVMLYIQNYYIQSPSCFSRSWYLAVDFQLYILSPLLLIPMWKWGKKFAPVVALLALMSIGSVMGIFIANEFRSLRGINPNEFDLTYVPMHTRASPWLVGFALGYFMHINAGRTFHISKVIQILGWIVSFLTFAAIIFGPIFTVRAHGKGTIFEAAMYEGWKRFSWAVALSWVTFACHFGMGGIVDGILSHPIWQPIARLTYSMYLVHSNVLRINLGQLRTGIYFSTYEEILKFWSAFGMTLVFSSLSSLAFESPILVIEKFIFGRREPAKITVKEPIVTSKVTLEVF